jgi:aquaporin Z
VPAVAETFGTFCLTYVGVLVLTAGGAALFGNGTKNLLAVALAQGLAIAVTISATATVATVTLNPAITVTLWVTRRLGGAQAAYNVAGQFAGALLGGLLARASIGGGDITAGIPALHRGVGFGQGLLVETLLTFLLVSVVLGTAADYRSSARLGGIAMGGAVALDILAGGPITGAAMNPARWLGPALAQGAFPNGWVYLFGPVGGALIAGLLWNQLLLARRR